jgi:hypothetical protein
MKILFVKIIYPLTDDFINSVYFHYRNLYLYTLNKII